MFHVKFCWTRAHFVGSLIPCFGLQMTVPMGFKARVESLFSTCTFFLRIISVISGSPPPPWTGENLKWSKCGRLAKLHVLKNVVHSTPLDQGKSEMVKMWKIGKITFFEKWGKSEMVKMWKIGKITFFEKCSTQYPPQTGENLKWSKCGRLAKLHFSKNGENLKWSKCGRLAKLHFLKNVVHSTPHRLGKI